MPLKNFDEALRRWHSDDMCKWALHIFFPIGHWVSFFPVESLFASAFWQLTLTEKLVWKFWDELANLCKYPCNFCLGKKNFYRGPTDFYDKCLVVMVHSLWEAVSEWKKPWRTSQSCNFSLILAFVCNFFPKKMLVYPEIVNSVMAVTVKLRIISHFD